jgi:hypothetical protein
MVPVVAQENSMVMVILTARTAGFLFGEQNEFIRVPSMLVVLKIIDD